MCTPANAKKASKDREQHCTFSNPYPRFIFPSLRRWEGKEKNKLPSSAACNSERVARWMAGTKSRKQVWTTPQSLATIIIWWGEKNLIIKRVMSLEPHHHQAQLFRDIFSKQCHLSFYEPKMTAHQGFIRTHWWWIDINKNVCTYWFLSRLTMGVTAF